MDDADDFVMNDPFKVVMVTDASIIQITFKYRVHADLTFDEASAKGKFMNALLLVAYGRVDRWKMRFADQKDAPSAEPGFVVVRKPNDAPEAVRAALAEFAKTDTAAESIHDALRVYLEKAENVRDA